MGMGDAVCLVTSTKLVRAWYEPGADTANACSFGRDESPELKAGEDIENDHKGYEAK